MSAQVNTEVSQAGTGGGGGGGAVTEADGANVALGTTTDPLNASINTTPATLVGILKAISNYLGNVVAKDSTLVAQATDIQSVKNNTLNLSRCVDAPGVDPGQASSVQGTVGGLPIPVSGPLTDTQLRATAVPVSGPLTDTQLRAAAVPVSGPLTDTQLRATAVPVSLTTLPPLVAGAALIGKVGIDQTTPGATNGVQVNAALPAGANVIGKVSIDQTTPGTTNQVFETANKWADPANRQYFTLSCVHIAGVTVEALLSCAANTNGVAAAAATSFTVPVGKTLRLTSLHVECHNTSTVASIAEVTVRAVPPAGSLTAASPIVARGLAQVIGALAANGGADDISIPEGVCLPAGAIVGVSQVCAATTCNVSVVLVGYLY